MNKLVHHPSYICTSVLAVISVLSFLVVSFQFANAGCGQPTQEDTHRRSGLLENLEVKSHAIKVALLHRPAPCLTNFTPGTEISPWVQQLQCFLTKSANRIQYLTNEGSKRTADLETSMLLFSDDDDSSSSLASNQKDISLESDVWFQHGEYVMNVEIGTPARVYTGIVDTGSDLTWIQCHHCTSCYFQAHAIFRPSSSSTYRHVDCQSEACENLTASFCNFFNDYCGYNYRYGDMSFTSGSLSTETFTLNSTDGAPVQFPGIVFGCAHGSRGSFMEDGVDGIIGLGQGSLSLSTQVGHQLEGNKFAYCLVSRRFSPKSVTSSFYYGDAAVPSNSTGLTYTKIIPNERHPAFYYLDWQGMSVGDKRLNFPPESLGIRLGGRGGTIIDSGTTVTNIEGTAYDALIDRFKEIVTYPTKQSLSGFELCYDLSGNRSPQFPSLVFHLEGVDLDLPLENYIIEAEDDTYCLAFHRSNQDGLSIIGNIQQQNYHIIYDNDNKRVGFQPTMCG